MRGGSARLITFRSTLPYLIATLFGVFLAYLVVVLLIFPIDPANQITPAEAAPPAPVEAAPVIGGRGKSPGEQT